MKSRNLGPKIKSALSYLVFLLLIFGLLAYFLDKDVMARPEVRSAFLAQSAFAMILAVAFGFAAASRVIRPLRRIEYAVSRFSEGDFGYKIIPALQGDAEILAQMLNGMAEDIEKKIRELEMQNQHLGAILHSMAEGIIALDKDNRIILINAPAEKIFNIKKKNAQNRFFLEVIPNNDIAELISSTLEKEHFISKEISLAWPVQKLFLIDASPIFEAGEINGCLIVIHDITEARKVESMRKDFIANVSHELKTPLTSIKGFAETLLEGALEDRQNARDFLNIIKEHTGRMDDIVSDLLSLSYLESREAKLNKKPVYVKTLLDNILASLRSELKKKSIKSKNNIPAGLSIMADESRLKQVFINLIDNAVKFNRDEGSVIIYNEEEAESVKFVVEDAGVGIPQRDIPRIFERFYRVDKARSREMGGTGLGLSIVKHIVELHGGSVGVESTEGSGSKFFFTLPK